MNCPSCQHPNPDDAKFCMNCGNPLATSCPNCGQQVPAGSRFCLHCGHSLIDEQGGRSAPVSTAGAKLQENLPRDLRAKLEDARTSGGLRGERKMVTALFSDIVGSTAMAEKMDPEDWRDVVSGAHRLVSQAVYKYEGTIAQLLGDGVLAFFGAPLAHEDDPERAVLAALGIQKAIREYAADLRQKGRVSEFQTRVGINTGVVVVGDIGTDLHMEYLAVGDAVNLAARVQQNAEPGAILVTAETHKLIAPLFEFQDLGDLEVKGKTEPIRIYRALRPKAARGALRGIQGLDAPLIERDQEMHVLRDAIESLRAGRGQIVSVIGEAGLGKSRLMTELRKSLASEGSLRNLTSDEDKAERPDHTPPLRWHEGRSLSYESTTPFAPFIDLLTDCFGLQPEWTDAARYAHIQSELTGLMANGAEEAAAVLSSMLGIGLPPDDFQMIRFLEPPALRQQVFASTMECLEHLAEMQPMVLVFDDLHWIDPTSLDLLAQLLSLTERTPLMVTALFRPRKEEAAWRFHETAGREFGHRYTPLTLKPLDEGGSRLLVSSLLHVEDLPERVRALILEKAEGNPFFVEEIIRSLLDARLVVRENSHWKATRDIEKITVPDTLIGVITARLDRLDDRAKLAVQAAAVIGRQFEFETLEAIYPHPDDLEEALSELERRELVREKARTPKRVYQFKHALTQETAYDSLLRRQCQDLHLRVAEYLEKAQVDRPEEIARHFLKAEQQARALPYLVEAGERAARSSSSTEAAALFTQALGILKRVQDTAMARRVYEGLGGVSSLTGDIQKAVETYKEMQVLADEYDDQGMEVSALNKLAMIYGVMLEDIQEATDLLGDAEKLATSNQDTAGMAEMYTVKCNLCAATGDLEGMAEHMQQFTLLGTEHKLEEPLLFGYAHNANALTLMARFDEAWETAQEALRLADQFGNRRWHADVLSTSFTDHFTFAGDLGAARQAGEEAIRLASAMGVFPVVWGAAYRLGEVARLQGDYEQTLAYAGQAYAMGQQAGTGFVQMLPFSSVTLAHLSLNRFDEERIRTDIETLARLMETPSGAAWGAAASRAVGFCHLVLGELDLAAEAFRAGLTVPTAFLHLAKPDLLVGLAGVASLRGDTTEATGYLEQARSYAEQVGHRLSMPMITLAQGFADSASGEQQEALRHFGQAEREARNIGLRPILLQACCGEAAALESLGRDNEAEAKRREAQEVIDEIAGLIQDDGLRDEYRQSASTLLTSPGPVTC
jgi:class 3 adenylate cyclase/tetratricopeptide (TPR) repeat protein